MNKCLLILLFIFASCNDIIERLAFQKFQKFIKKYHKKYESMNEYLKRFDIFKRNLISTSLENEKVSYKTGINKFSDLTKQEFAKIYLNLNYNAKDLKYVQKISSNELKTSPESFDWRDYGVVSDVKEHGQCSDDWAKVAIGHLESIYAIKKGTLKTFSE